MAQLILRPLSVADIEAAIALDQVIFGGFWSERAYRSEIERDSSCLLGIWLMPSDRPSGLLVAMGCSWQILEEAHLILLGVHPQHRRCLLAKGLLVALLGQSQQQQAHYATLEVRSTNQAALSLYQKFQFHVVGRRRGYYEDTNEDALVLWRQGLQQPETYTQLQQMADDIITNWQQAHWTLANDTPLYDPPCGNSQAW